MNFKYISKLLLRFLSTKGILNSIPDAKYLKIAYWCETGKKLNLDKPLTYNEKLQWLKLYNKNDTYSNYVDKYLVRAYVAKMIGEEYLVPLYDVFDSVDEIDWNKLPNQFVLKCTHGSHSNIICNDKSVLDIKKAKKMLNKWMKKNWFWYGREWPYKYVKPRIICEKYLEDNITDYKIMCFNGEPKLIQVHQNRGQKSKTLDFYTVDWKRSEVRRNTNNSSNILERPLRLDEMINISKKLSTNEIHVRIDLYEVEGKVYFGEKTYFSSSGFATFAKDKYDLMLGEMINLPYITE